MKNRTPFVEKLTVLCILTTVTFLASCSQSSSPSPATQNAKASAGERVFVQFEGPWAFVADPKDANMVLAIAPKTKAHRDLNVSGSNNLNLTAGIYDLSIPPHGVPATANLDNTFAQVKIDSKSLQSAIDSHAGRYVVRLPKPETYVAARRVHSRFGTSYPPDASTEQKYVTAVSLRYTVNSLSGFSLSGTPDSGTFNPYVLQLDLPAIHFVIEPAQADDPLDKCSLHSRQAFRDLTALLNVTAYVDFSDDAADCHGKDPQRPAPGKTTARLTQLPISQEDHEFLAAGLERIGGSTIGIKGQPSFSGVGPRSAHLLFATVATFLHLSGVDCRAPILFLTMNQ